MTLAALFHLYLFFCPLDVVRPNDRCHSEYRGTCELQACGEIAVRDARLYPGKRLVSSHMREVR